MNNFTLNNIVLYNFKVDTFVQFYIYTMNEQKIDQEPLLRAFINA